MPQSFQYCPICGTPLQPANHGGRERLACATDGCGFVHWDNPTPVVAAVIEYRDEVLLVRNVGWPEKWFGLVSGFLERDESPQDGILREIQEEVGLTGEIISLIGVYPFTMMNQVIIAYHVVADGEIELNEELTAYKLIAPERLRPWPMGTGEAVRDWISARTL